MAAPRPLRVLVVDDNRDLVETTMALLQVEGHIGSPCYNGSEVFNCVKEFDPDVVVMDIGLPGKSGWDAAKEIRRDSQGKRPVLIGMSGEFTRGAHKALAQVNGFDYYLAKPIDPKVLMALVNQWAPSRRASTTDQ